MAVYLLLHNSCNVSQKAAQLTFGFSINYKICCMILVWSKSLCTFFWGGISFLSSVLDNIQVFYTCMIWLAPHSDKWAEMFPMS